MKVVMLTPKWMDADVVAVNEEEDGDEEGCVCGKNNTRTGSKI